MSRKFFDMNEHATFELLWWDWLYEPVREKVTDWPPYLTAPVHYQEKPMASRELGRWLSKHEERAQPPQKIHREASDLDSYMLTVREVNNLVRFHMMNGWISREHHENAHGILRSMIDWLEKEHGIEVSIHMREL